MSKDRAATLVVMVVGVVLALVIMNVWSGGPGLLLGTIVAAAALVGAFAMNISQARRSRESMDAGEHPPDA